MGWVLQEGAAVGEGRVLGADERAVEEHLVRGRDRVIGSRRAPGRGRDRVIGSRRAPGRGRELGIGSRRAPGSGRELGIGSRRAPG